MTTPLGNRLLAALAFIFVVATAGEAAQFTNSFDGIKQGDNVRLMWEGVAPQNYPLYITAQVIERIGGDGNGDGFKANGYRVNITSALFLCFSLINLQPRREGCSDTEQCMTLADDASLLITCSPAFCPATA